MIDLISSKAHICLTAGGVLIVDRKVMLVKHKKLGIWLAPGGHQEEDELLHQTAEREVFEETGIRVKAISPIMVIESNESQYLPVPIVSNLHWVCEENYRLRMISNDKTQLNLSKVWPRGCEQHLGHIYLVKPIDELAFHHDPNESTDIGWFSEGEVDLLDTRDSIKQELHLAFSL